MRWNFAIVAVTGLILLPASLPAAMAAPPKALTATVRPDNPRLDRLFSTLKRERNDAAADGIAHQIANIWMQSGSATVDLLMQWADDAINAQKYNVALDFLDQVTTLDPQFAEGWNQRATVHFLRGEYAMSMSDIDKTLSLEPRHFGALAGMAQILENTGRKKLALQAYQRVLAIYPMMRDAQGKVAALSEELAGEVI